MTVDTCELVTVIVPATVWVVTTVVPSAPKIPVSDGVLVSVTTTVATVDGVNVSTTVDLRASVFDEMGSVAVAIKLVQVVEL